VVTDARRREIAWSIYGPEDAHGVPNRLRGPELAAPEALRSADFDGYERIDAVAISAAALGTVGARRMLAGLPSVDPEPLYLRPPDVTLAPPKRVSG
jgi:hypothetical protein